MSQILKKRAKLIYIIMFALSLLVFVSSTVYITAYNDTALNYKKNVLTDPKAVTATGNDNLYLFIEYLSDFEAEGVEEAEFNYEYKDFTDNYGKVFRSMFDFNQNLQLTNNSIFYLGLFSMAMVAVMCICANASRKKYYISNLVSGVACPAATIVFSGVTLAFNIIAMVSLNANWELINWGALGNQNHTNIIYTDPNGIYTSPEAITPVVKWFIEGDTSHFCLSNNTLIIYSIILVVFMICNGLLIAYNVFRYLDTKKELRLEGLGE